MQGDHRIYVITNLQNGKKYVGHTCQNLSDRWAQHVWNANEGKPFALPKAIAKYGRESFSIEELCSVPTLGGVYLAERFYISLLGTLVPNGYNLGLGGAGLGFGFKMSEEARQKMSKAHLGQKNHNFGRTHSPELKKKMSEGRKGKCLGRIKSAEELEKMRLANIGPKNPAYGKPMHKNTRAAIRKANDERRATLSARNQATLSF